MISAFVVLLAFILVPLPIALLSVGPTWTGVWRQAKWRISLSEIMVLSFGVCGVLSLMAACLAKRYEITREGWAVVVLTYLVIGGAWFVEGLALEQMNIRGVLYPIALKALAAFGGFGAPLLGFWLLPALLQSVERDYGAERIVIGCAVAYALCLSVHWYLRFAQASAAAPGS